jgi:hypothetical protein
VLAAGDQAAAGLALAQAESRIGEDGPADLVTLLAAAKRDRDLVRDLRELEDMSWTPGYGSNEEVATMSERYRAAFSRYGLAVAGADLDAVADAVRASRVSAALIAGLSEWFSIDPKGLNLRQLLDRLDPDPDRAAIRLALQAGDEGLVRALVRALDGAKTPAWFAVSVGYHQMVPPLDGVRLLSASWRNHDRANVPESVRGHDPTRPRTPTQHSEPELQGHWLRRWGRSCANDQPGGRRREPRSYWPRLRYSSQWMTSAAVVET